MATLLTQREAALALRLSERTLERWRVQGIGPRFIRSQHLNPLSPTRLGCACRSASCWLDVGGGATWLTQLRPRHPQHLPLYLA
jgi:hypothetical protein